MGDWIERKHSTTRQLLVNAYGKNQIRAQYQGAFNLTGRQWKNCRGEVSFGCGTKKTERWCANATERKQRTRTGR